MVIVFGFGEVECCHYLDCYLNSVVTYMIHILSLVTRWEKKLHHPLSCSNPKIQNVLHSHVLVFMQMRQHLEYPYCKVCSNQVFCHCFANYVRNFRKFCDCEVIYRNLWGRFLNILPITTLGPPLHSSSYAFVWLRLEGQQMYYLKGWTALPYLDSLLSTHTLHSTRSECTRKLITD